MAAREGLDRSAQAAIQQTLQSLNQTFDDTTLASTTGLGLPAIRELKQEIAEIFPASNLPAFLLQGLMQLKGRNLEGGRVAADLRVLFRETAQIGLYSAVIGAPALMLHGYQLLLALAGKDVTSAFPDGEWQFYTEFGLREDAARHCTETVGFQQAAAGLSDADAAACWVYAAICTLFAYDDLLENEWHERMLLRALDDVLAEQAAGLLSKPLPRKAVERERLITEQADKLRREYRIERLAAEWSARRPFAGPPGDSLDGYVASRRAAFDAYLERALRQAPAGLGEAARQCYAERRDRDLPAYQRQMTLLMMLGAESYREQREPLPLPLARVALLSGGQYFLIDVCERDEQGNLLITPRDGQPGQPGVSFPLSGDPEAGGWRDSYGHPVLIDRSGAVRVNGTRVGRLRTAPLATVRGQVSAALRQAKPQRAGAGVAGAPPPPDLLLAQAPRSRQQALRARLPAATQAAIAALRTAPIIVNWDRHDGQLPLGELRQARRGCGDHALTLLRTDRSMVFDMSHIFFDGAWGMALAEIMTGFASNLSSLPGMGRPARNSPITPLSLDSSPGFLADAYKAIESSPVEVCVESSAIDLAAINQLRRRLAGRQINLTVNDMLLLARCDHAARYQPGPRAAAVLDALAASESGARLRHQIEEDLAAMRAINPALLIPMDASAVDPRRRLFPTTFRNYVPELLPRLDRCYELVLQLRRRHGAADLQLFEDERRKLAAELLRFGLLLRALRQVTMRGESFNSAALRLMGHLPGGVQSLVDLIPQKFDLLNEIVKGREVFSNAGQVVAGSSLTRFSSSRDDGDTKTLVWGLMSDARGQLRVTLRDFRPHVAPLRRQLQDEQARVLAQDFLDAYADCANSLVKRLQRVLSYK